MSAHVLLNSLKVLTKREIKCKACQAFYLFLAMSYRSMNVRFYLSYDNYITLKSHLRIEIYFSEFH